MNRAVPKVVHVSVADLKREFSDYVNRVRQDGTRCVLSRRGRKVAVLVSLEDFQRLCQLDGQENPGLLGCLGSWSEMQELDQIVDELYEARGRAIDRPVSLEE